MVVPVSPYLKKQTFAQNKNMPDFPGGPEIKTPSANAKGHRLNPWSQNIPPAGSN